MRKLLLLLLPLIHFCLFSPAQQVLKEAGLRYIVTDTRTGPDGKSIEMSRSNSFVYTPDGYRSYQQMQENIFYTNTYQCKDSLPVSYFTNGEKYYSFEDIGKSSLFDMGRMRDRQTTIRYTDDTASIAGMPCKKAIMTLLMEGKAEQIEIWYSPAFRIQPGCFPYFFDRLEGLPVSIRYAYYSGVQIKGINLAATREYLLDTLYITGIDALIPPPDEKKYVRISKEETLNVMMQIMNSRRPPAKAKPITSQTKTGDGMTITRTQYNPFTIGDTLAAFAGTSPDGRLLNSETTYKGKPMVINFWFTRCAPCIKEMPLLNDVALRYKDSPISFISITHDSAKEITGFLKKNTFLFEPITDAQDLIDQYGVFTYPATVITDKDHVIRYIRIGGIENDSELMAEIKKILE